MDMKHIIFLIFSCMILVHTGSAMAENFADCILDKMPGTSNRSAALAVFKSCATDHPEKYAAIEKGSGSGWFGFKDQEACIIKKSRDTVQQNAVFMIAAACRCLYGKPELPVQMCASDGLQ